MCTASARAFFATITGLVVLGENGHAHLAAQDAELLDGGGPLQVGRDQQRVASLLLERAGQLGCVGRFTGPLQARQQHHGGRPRCVRQPQRRPPQDAHQLVVDCLHHLLAG